MAKAPTAKTVTITQYASPQRRPADQQQVLEQWRGESERLVKEARAKLVRRRAEAAWSRRSFSEAAQLYASIRDELTQSEIARQEYCRRRTLLVSVPRAPRVAGLA